MPQYICKGPGCQRTAPPGARWCPRCEDKGLAAEKQREAARDRRRGTSHERGYDGNWQKHRLRHLRENPFCVRCTARFGPTLADSGDKSAVVDHIVRVNGPDDPLFWYLDNHQTLCNGPPEWCHNWKTQRADKEILEVFGKATKAGATMNEALDQAVQRWLELMRND